MSTAVSFESHVFSNAAPAQVAVLDAYRGSAKSTPHIQDSEAHRSEDDKKPLRSRSFATTVLSQSILDCTKWPSSTMLANRGPRTSLSRSTVRVMWLCVVAWR